MESLKSMQRMAQYYKETYPPGTRIELLSMEDPYDPVPSGTKGTVSFVDDLGQLHMKWDNGRTLALVPSQDQFHKLNGQELSAEGSLEAKLNKAAASAADSISPSNHIDHIGETER